MTSEDLTLRRVSRAHACPPTYPSKSSPVTSQGEPPSARPTRRIWSVRVAIVVPARPAALRVTDHAETASSQSNAHPRFQCQATFDAHRANAACRVVPVALAISAQE